MAPSQQIGRPKVPWNASRSRKLVRLYLMTDLSIQRIQEALKARGFTPGRRNIQMQLKTLLPEYSKIWRQHRPTREQMQNRLAELKKSREKHGPRHQKVQSDRKGKAKISIEKESVLTPRIESGDGDILAPTCRSFSGTPPRHFRLSITTSEESQSSKNPDGVQSGNPKAIVSANYAPQDTAPDLSLASPEGWRNKLEQPNPGADHSDPLSNLGSPLSTSSSLRALHSECIRIGSSRSIHGSGRESMKTSSTRSFCSIRHLHSVLSPSLSLRSSLCYTTSLSSTRQSSGSIPPWTSDELDSWKQFVDESAFPQRDTRPKEEPEKSLRDRPCCSFFKSRSTWRAPSSCKTCGFSEMHWRARFSKVDDTTRMDPTSSDYFGNTPLHHAAAAGNTAQVLNLMSSLLRPSSTNSQRNTSGETFLHVFRLKRPEQFSAYEEVLEKASNLGFPFDIVDHQGQRISQILQDLLDDWSICSTQLTKVAKILGMEKIPQCFDGKLKGRDLNESWYEYEDSRNISETKLMSTLKNWDNEKKSEDCLRTLIQDTDIHIRDKRGYTALAIAAGNGVHEAVRLLLEAGANPNTRSHHRTSVMEYAERHLRQAQRKAQNCLYAQILSCMALLSDRGAKANVSVYDEYGMIDPSPKYRVTNSRPRQNLNSSIARKSAIRVRPRRKLESIIEPSYHPQESSRKTTPGSSFKDLGQSKTPALTEPESNEQFDWTITPRSEPEISGDTPLVTDRSDFDTAFQEAISYVACFNPSQIYERDNEEEITPLLVPSIPSASTDSGRDSENFPKDHGCSDQVDTGEAYAQDLSNLQAEDENALFQQGSYSLSVQEPTERCLGSEGRLGAPEPEFDLIESSIDQTYSSWSLKSGQLPVLPPDTMVSSTFASHGTPNLNASGQELGWLLHEEGARPPPLPPRNIKLTIPRGEDGLPEARTGQAEFQGFKAGDNLYSFQENRGTTTGITPQIREFTFAPYDPSKVISKGKSPDKVQELSLDEAYQWYGMAGIFSLSSFNESGNILQTQEIGRPNGLSKQASAETLVTPSSLEPISAPDKIFPREDGCEDEAFNPAKRRRMAPKSDMLEVLREQGWSGWR